MRAGFRSVIGPIPCGTRYPVRTTVLRKVPKSGEKGPPYRRPLSRAQSLRHGQPGGPQRRKEAAEQPDDAGPDDARDDQCASDRQLEYDLREGATQRADAVPVEEQPNQRRAD